MPSLEVVDAYYSQSGLPLRIYEAGHQGTFVAYTSPPFSHSEVLDSAAVDESLLEISRNLRMIERGGSYFEISVANSSVAGDEVMLHFSTYSSALTTNTGNAYELAAQAVRYPDYKHLYIASFGNGSTAPLLPADAAYARKTGRFTREQNSKIVPLQTIQNLHEALRQENLHITRIMGTDSAGGHYARALALAMERGQLSHAFFSETSGFVDLSMLQIIGGMLITERRNAELNKNLSPDPEKIDDEKKERAKVALQKFHDTTERVRLHEHKVPLNQTLLSMKDGMQALRRGPTKHSNPLASESNALLAHHTAAKITYGMAEEDPLYISPEKCHQAAISFLGALSVQQAPVKIIIIPGMTHAYNTYFPSLYHAVKKFALEL